MVNGALWVKNKLNHFGVRTKPYIVHAHGHTQYDIFSRTVLFKSNDTLQQSCDICDILTKSNEPGHSSLIIVFAVRLKAPWSLGYT